jgi:hypothetical protein
MNACDDLVDLCLFERRTTSLSIDSDALVEHIPKIAALVEQPSRLAREHGVASPLGDHCIDVRGIDRLPARRPRLLSEQMQQWFRKWGKFFLQVSPMLQVPSVFFADWMHAGWRNDISAVSSHIEARADLGEVSDVDVGVLEEQMATVRSQVRQRARLFSDQFCETSPALRTINVDGDEATDPTGDDRNVRLRPGCEPGG